MPQSHTHLHSHPWRWRSEGKERKAEGERVNGGKWEWGSTHLSALKAWNRVENTLKCLQVSGEKTIERFTESLCVLSDIKHSCRLESDLSCTLPLWNMSNCCWCLLFFVFLYSWCCTWPLSPQGHPVVGHFDLRYLFFLSKAWHLKIMPKDKKFSHHLAFCVKPQYHLFCPFWHTSVCLFVESWRKEEEVCKLLTNSFETWVNIVSCFPCQQACNPEKRENYPTSEINILTQTCCGCF